MDGWRRGERWEDRPLGFYHSPLCLSPPVQRRRQTRGRPATSQRAGWPRRPATPWQTWRGGGGCRTPAAARGAPPAGWAGSPRCWSARKCCPHKRAMWSSWNYLYCVAMCFLNAGEYDRLLVVVSSRSDGRSIAFLPPASPPSLQNPWTDTTCSNHSTQECKGSGGETQLATSQERGRMIVGVYAGVANLLKMRDT